MARRPSLRDRLLTRAGAGALMSPAAVLAAGAAAGIGLAAGVPVALAAGAGVAAWAVGVGVALPRARPATATVDARRLRPAWRRYVEDARSALERYRATVAATAPGPLRDRLAEVGGGIESGVEECCRVAAHGDAIDAALERLDTTGARRDLAAARALPPSDAVARTIQALEAQLATADRLARASADGQARLRLLDARLDELVARAVELSLAQGDESTVGGLGTDVDALVAELEALREALAGTSGPAVTSPGPVTGR